MVDGSPRLTRRLRIGKGKNWPDLTDDQQTGVLDWIVDVCLLHGASLATAYLVAAEFAHGIEPSDLRRWPR